MATSTHNSYGTGGVVEGIKIFNYKKSLLLIHHWENTHISYIYINEFSLVPSIFYCKPTYWYISPCDWLLHLVFSHVMLLRILASMLAWILVSETQDPKHWWFRVATLEGINISPLKRHISRWFSFSPLVGYVNSLEGKQNHISLHYPLLQVMC